MSYVVISYSHEDRAFVTKLAEALRARRNDIWFDEGLRAGQDFSSQIHRNIVEATALIVVWSKNASTSKWVKSESLKAFELDKSLILVVKERWPLEVPFNIFHAADFSDWDLNASARKIDELASSLPPPSPSPEPAPGRDTRTSLEEITPFLAAEAKIEVICKIADGELSDVYRGKQGRRALAIKVFPNSLLPATVKQNLLAEVALTSNLNHPSFLQIVDVLFDKHFCFIVSDHLDGGKTIARKIDDEGPSAFSVEEVVDIMKQLCKAVVEAEVVGLSYINITPSQIYIKDDRTQILAQQDEPGGSVLI